MDDIDIPSLKIVQSVELISGLNTLSDSDNEFLAELNQVLELHRQTNTGAGITGGDARTGQIQDVDMATKEVLVSAPGDASDTSGFSNNTSIASLAEDTTSLTERTVSKHSSQSIPNSEIKSEATLANSPNIYTIISSKTKFFTRRWGKFAVWPAIIGMIAGGVGIWQANELAERAFRLEILHKTMDNKLIEAMLRIDILKATLIHTEQRLQLLEQRVAAQTPKVTTSIPNTAPGP